MKHFLIAALAALFITPALAGFESADITPPTADIIERFANDDDCEAIDNPDWQNMWQGVALDANTRAHLVPCFLAAYNVSHRLILERRDDESDVSEYSLAHFAGFADELGWYARTDLINADIDEKTGELSEFSKGRGVGDCGSIARWTWTGGDFAMIEYAYEGECNGRLPDEWPLIYQRTADKPDAPAPQTKAQDCSQAPYCEDRRYFKDWLAACRPATQGSGRYCSANAYVHNANAPAGYDYQLRVSRDRAGEPLRISLIAVFDLMSRKDAVDIHIDGIRQIMLAPDEIETPEAINDYFIGPQEHADFLIDAMKKGFEIRFDYVTDEGKPASASFSLAGLVASLLWIEEQAAE
ncbi:MAG: DUF1176 domain-containing protein [Parvibaculum sp.]